MGQRVKVSGSEFLVEIEEGDGSKGQLNGKPFEWDVSKLSDTLYHAIKDNRSYEIELLQAVEGKQQVRVNGNIYETETIDELDELLKKMGMEKGTAGKVSDLKAPMPGLVLEIAVKAGDTVQKGDKILVLEAMKMENIIKSPTDAVIASVDVNQGTTVDKGQVMVTFS